MPPFLQTAFEVQIAGAKFPSLCLAWSVVHKALENPTTGTEGTSQLSQVAQSQITSLAQVGTCCQTLLTSSSSPSPYRIRRIPHLCLWHPTHCPQQAQKSVQHLICPSAGPMVVASVREGHRQSQLGVRDSPSPWLLHCSVYCLAGEMLHRRLRSWGFRLVVLPGQDVSVYPALPRC